MRESVSWHGKVDVISVLCTCQHFVGKVGLVYTADSILIAAAITLGLVIFLTIFAFQVLLCIFAIYNII